MIETKRSQSTLTRLYVRNQPVETGADIRLYDIGKFQLATQGMQNVVDPDANSSIGELWVTYQVKFFKPKISDIGLCACDIFNTTEQATDNSIDNLTPFGFIKNPVAGSSQHVSLEDGNQVIFAPWIDTGYYFFSYSAFINNGGSDHGVPQITNQVNCRVVQMWDMFDPVGNYFYAPTAGSLTSTRIGANWLMKVTGATVAEQLSASFIFDWSFNWAFAGSASGMTLVVTKIPQQLGDTFALL